MEKVFIVLGTALVLFLLVWWWYKKKKSVQPSQNTGAKSPAEPPSDPQTSIAAEVNDIFGKLVDLRLKLAVETVDQSTQRLFDSIIDKLELLLPRMKLEYGGNPLTFEVTRIAKTHLQELFVDYLRLSQEKRITEKQKLEQALSLMYQELDKIQRMVDERDTSKFGSEAAFLSEKFSTSSSVEAV